MNLRRHGIAVAIAAIAFGILTLLSGTGGWPSLYAVLGLLLVSTAGYFHYRRRSARKLAIPAPVVPVIDTGEITADIKAFVAARDGGVCQIKAPCCIVDRQIEYDHIIPRSWGGPTTRENIQVSCRPCNRFKLNHWAGTYANQMTRDQVKAIV